MVSSCFFSRECFLLLMLELKLQALQHALVFLSYLLHFGWWTSSVTSFLKNHVTARSLLSSHIRFRPWKDANVIVESNQHNWHTGIIERVPQAIRLVICSLLLSMNIWLVICFEESSNVLTMRRLVFPSKCRFSQKTKGRTVCWPGKDWSEGSAGWWKVGILHLSQGDF